MKYKALFLDIDGTTVVHGIHNLASSRVTKAITRCTDAGVAVCLATSRILEITIPIIEHLKLTGLCVVAGGVQIYDPQKKKVIQEKLLSKKTVPEIYHVARKFNQELWTYDGVKEKPYAGGALPEKLYGIYFPKLRPAVVQEVEKALKTISDISVHRMDSWYKGYEWIDVTDAEATKLHGIVEIAKLLGIQTHEMIGVGDGYNDFPLLMACGLKIAMGNAVAELKAIADFIAPSVEEDGVATVIEKFILHE